jgi:hypothetical protein
MGLSGLQNPRHLGGTPIDLTPCCANAARFQCLGDSRQAQRPDEQCHLRRRLTGFEIFPPKPKGMHWRTFERHCAELLAADDPFYRWAGVMFAGLW